MAIILWFGWKIILYITNSKQVFYFFIVMVLAGGSLPFSVENAMKQRWMRQYLWWDDVTFEYFCL